MARVPYLTQEDLEPDDRVLLDRPVNIFRALVNSPNGARAFARHGLYLLNRSKLDPRLRELAIIQVGYVTKSRYEYSHHVEIGRQTASQPMISAQFRRRRQGARLPSTRSTARRFEPLASYRSMGRLPRTRSQPWKPGSTARA